MLLQVFQPAYVVRFDEGLRDIFVRLHATETPDERLAVIDIDERAMQEIGPWPWPRAKVADLIAEEGNPDLKLRVFVQGGGCSGFQYGFTFDEITNEDDTTMSKNGVSLLIDAMSYQYLIGAEIDYKEDLQGAQFVIKNPNATSTCGCGSSFST